MVVLRPVSPQRGLVGADLGTLARLGVVDPPPAPPGDGPGPGQSGREKLRAALAEVGGPLDADEEAAVERLCLLPSGTVDMVARWIRRGKRDK